MVHVSRRFTRDTHSSSFVKKGLAFVYPVMSDEGEIDVESDDVADVGDIRESALSPKVR